MLKYSIMVIVLIHAFSCVPEPRTEAVYPSDDAFVWHFDPGTNYGTTNSARIGKLSADLNLWWEFWETQYNQNHQHMWTTLKFDLEPYYGVLIDSAKVAVYVYSTHGTFPPDQVWVARLTSDWDEDVITWNNKPSHIDWHVTSPPVYAWWTIDVTEWVQEWLFDSSPNYGLLIGTNAIGLDWFEICTKEEPGTTSNPQLILYYTEYVTDPDESD